MPIPNPPPGFDPNAPIPEAEWSNPNSKYFTEYMGESAKNWRFNAGTGQWEPGNANMDVSNAITGALAPGSTGFVSDADPGASLDTGQPDAARDRMGEYLAQLTGQAKTGGGAWERALAQNTYNTQQAASAIGQSQPGVDSMNAARGIGNAQTGAAQRAVGQGNLLRAQTQQQAMGRISDALGGQGALDAQQAATSGAVNQGVRATNTAAQQAGDKAVRQMAGASGQAIVAGMDLGFSDGGRVPGQPGVFGDDERNDVVPARLSPGEIVIPISITSRPDAAQAAAAFVEAVKARGPIPGQSHFDSGGEIPLGRLGASPFSDVADPTPLYPGNRASTATLPGEAPVDGKKQAPSITNGGMLAVKPYNETRDADIANSSSLLAAYLGQGPSTAPQAMQNATDTTIADAMRARASARGPVDVTAAAAEQSQNAAGNAAGIVAGESQRAGDAYAEAVHRRRAQDLAFAGAQQQAAWRNTMMNAGIAIEQQNQLNGLLGGAGQGAASIADMFTPERPSGPSRGYDPNNMSLSGGKIYDDEMGKAHGGLIEENYADGGTVVAHLARRRGTTKAPPRPETDSSTSERRRAETGKRLRGRVTPPVVDPSWSGIPENESMETGKRLRARITPPVVDPSWSGVPENELNYADGGEVPGAASGAAPSTIGPSFFARLAEYMSSPVTSADAGRAIGMPPPRGEDIPLTPEEQAQRQTSFPAPPSGPMSVSHGTPARERPFMAKPAQPIQQAAPATETAPALRPAQRPMAPAKADPYAEQRQALEMRAGVEGQQAEAQAGVLSGLQRGLEENAIAQKEAHARATNAAEAQLGALQEAREELKNVDVTVDPDRYMARKGWGGRIAAVIGLVLGAIGNDNGVNRAAMLIQQNIDRDLEAQKAEHALRLRKGQANVDSAQNIYALSRQMTQDDIAANLAARGTMLDLAKNQVDLAAAKTGAPMAKANLASLSAALGVEKQKADDSMRQRGFDNHIKQMGADTDRMQAEAQAVAAGNRAAGGDKTQAALIANVEQENKTIQEQGQQLKSLIKKYGTSGGIGPGPGADLMKQSLMNMATAAAKLRDPTSVARASEVDAELKNLFQPGIFKSEATAMASIDAYLKNAEKRRNDAYQVRGLSAPGDEPRPTQPAATEAMPTATSKDGKKVKWTGEAWVAM